VEQDRTERLGAVLALGVLVALVIADVLVPTRIGVLTPLFVLAPMIACAVVPARGTAAIAAATIVAALASGWWDRPPGFAQQFIRVLTVVVVSISAVLVAAIRVRREARLARMSQIAEIAQRAILPVLPARVGSVQIAARYRSAGRDAMVGGDLFDCYHSRDHVRLIVGDVRGKGIGGVEQAARVIRAFRQSAALQETLTGVAEEMDDYLADFFDAEEFATAVLVEVSPGAQGRVVRLVSCGHPGPQLVHTRGSRVLELPPGTPLGLGLGSGPGFTAVDVEWSPGDRLLLYTDGVTEARDGSGEFYALADEVTRALAADPRAAEPRRLVALVRDGTLGHCGGRLLDDTTVFAVRRADEGAGKGRSPS